MVTQIVGIVKIVRKNRESSRDSSIGSRLAWGAGGPWFESRSRLFCLNWVNLIIWIVFFQNQVLCILTSFQVLAAPESWSKYFSQPFSTFFVISNLFQWFHGWNQSKVFRWFQSWNHWKRFEMNKKGWKWLKYTTSRL